MCTRLCILLLFLTGCDPIPPREWVTDSDLLRSIDFDNPQPTHVPALVSLLDDHSPDICERVYEALARIGEPAIPALVDKLKPGFQRYDFVVRSRASRALGRIGPSAIPALIDVLEGDGYDYVSILHALGDIDPTTDEAVNALMAALDKSQTRNVALHVLGRLGAREYPEVQAAVPPILAFLRHEDAEVRRIAAESLWHINTQTAFEVGVRDLGWRIPKLPALRDDSELLQSIDFCHAQPQEVSLLIQLFDDHSDQVFRRAADALIAIGQPAAAPLVEALRRDMPILVRVRAADVLRRLGPAAIPAVAAAIDGVRDHNIPYDLPKLIYVLGTIRPATADTVGLLLNVVENFHGNYDALEALMWLGPKAKDAVPQLLPLLEHSDARVRLWSARAIWNIDREAAHEAGMQGPWSPREAWYREADSL